jgi:hypothetical protein
MVPKIVMAGAPNSKTSLGEVFRRYIECFKMFSRPDVFDLQPNLGEMNLGIFPQYQGKIKHDIKYFHTTFKYYRKLKAQVISHPKPTHNKKIGYFVWESSEMHESDALVLKDFDEIWTASNYCRDIFSQYVDHNKIKVITHPLNCYTAPYRKYNKFTILIMGSLLSSDNRKGISASLELAAEIQKKYTDVDIIFKTWTCNDWERDKINTLRQLGNIKVIDDFYTPEKTEELIGRCHMLLSLHRSEGFGLTLAEAIINNTIPVATNYSSNTEYTLTDNVLIDAKIIDVDLPFFKGKWADPDLNDAYSKVENVINNYESVLSSLQSSKQYLIDNNSFYTVSEKIKNKVYGIQSVNNYTQLIAHPDTLLDKHFRGGLSNPGFVQRNGKNYLLCRAEHVSDLGRKTFHDGKADPVLLELDNSLSKVINYRPTLSVNSYSVGEKIEDFRFFTHQGAEMFTHTYIKDNMVLTAVSKLDTENNEIDIVFVPELLNFKTKKVEKNWSYFEHEGELYLLYSTQPYILFKHVGDFKFEKFIDYQLPLFEDQGPVSNSINPFKFQEHYIHIVHTKTGKTYRHYAILINSKTLLPEYVSQHPIFKNDNCFGSYPGLIYLTDYYLNEREKNITFFFGEGDMCVSKKVLSFDDINNLTWEII